MESTLPTMKLLLGNFVCSLVCVALRYTFTRHSETENESLGIGCLT